MNYPIIMQSTASSLAVCFSNNHTGHVVKDDSSYTVGDYSDTWASAESTDIWKPYSPPATETLCEWICVDGGDWVVHGMLLSEEHAPHYFAEHNIDIYQKTGRKFEVEITK